MIAPIRANTRFAPTMKNGNSYTIKLVINEFTTVHFVDKFNCKNRFAMLRRLKRIMNGHPSFTSLHFFLKSVYYRIEC